MSSRIAAEVSAGDSSASRREWTARSIVKRALVGIVLLVLMVTFGVLLMHAGIEAEADGLRTGAATVDPAGLSLTQKRVHAEP